MQMVGLRRRGVLVAPDHESLRNRDEVKILLLLLRARSRCRFSFPLGLGLCVRGCSGIRVKGKGFRVEGLGAISDAGSQFTLCKGVCLCVRQEDLRVGMRARAWVHPPHTVHSPSTRGESEGRYVGVSACARGRVRERGGEKSA